MPNSNQSPTFAQPAEILQPALAAALSLTVGHLSELPQQQKNQVIGIGLVAVGLALLSHSPR